MQTYTCLLFQRIFPSGKTRWNARWWASPNPPETPPRPTPQNYVLRGPRRGGCASCGRWIIQRQKRERKHTKSSMWRTFITWSFSFSRSLGVSQYPFDTSLWLTAFLIRAKCNSVGSPFLTVNMCSNLQRISGLISMADPSTISKITHI